jgi:hypothetical protein
MERIYHRLYENYVGMWCVEYTIIENALVETKCFETNEDAVKFYMS